MCVLYSPCTTFIYSLDPKHTYYVNAFCCIAVLCNTLGAPVNGQVIYSPDTTSPYDFGTMATYVCDSGFGISGGTRTRACSDGDGLTNAGVWSRSSVTCDGNLFNIFIVKKWL